MMNYPILVMEEREKRVFCVQQHLALSIILTLPGREFSSQDLKRKSKRKITVSYDKVKRTFVFFSTNNMI